MVITSGFGPDNSGSNPFTLTILFLYLFYNWNFIWILLIIQNNSIFQKQFKNYFIMSQDVQSTFDAMQGAFLQNSAENVVVLAEELPQEGGGIDYSKHFWEPQVGKSYTIKFITNPFGEPLTHRKIYKNLPDPLRQGKKFQVVSSNSAKTCDVLQLFFDLHALKKDGDPLAIQKLDNYMGITAQACALIQVLSSPDPAEVGIFRMFQISTAGPSPALANLINKKLNPTKEAIANGFEKEDIFNVFESAVLMIECEESDYDGRKGREYGKSDWAKKERGCFVDIKDEAGNVTERYTFSKADIVDGKVRAEALPAFKQLITELSNPDLSIHNYFSYKAIGDPKNSEDTEKYLVQLQEKIKEIVPIIKNAKNISEIANYGKGGGTSTGDSATMIGGTKASDILKDSIPSELSASIMNDTPVVEKPSENAANPADLGASNPDVMNILNS